MFFSFGFRNLRSLKAESDLTRRGALELNETAGPMTV